MKRSRENKDDASRAGTKKPKSIQACTSCRKHKTRCEILDPTKSPVRCHRCQVLTLQCSYEDTILPTASTSQLPSPESAEPPKTSTLNAMVTYPANLPPTDRIWAFVGEENSGIDWSAPMLAIQQLSKLPFAHLNVPVQPALAYPTGELTLHRILSDDQRRHLLDLFDDRYGPWLNFKPSRNTNSSLLDIACCAIASRHLDNASGSAQIKMQLQKLTEDSIAKMIFNPRPSESLEAVQALLILSLWAPLGGPPENDGRDGRLLIASAVSMAMNLRLNQSAFKAAVLQKRNRNVDRPSVEDAEALKEMTENARLWIALTNTESMLCIGTGRIPLSRRSPEDLQLVEYPKTFVNVNHGDLRLGMTASTFDLVEEAVGNRLQGKDVDDWYDEMMVILEKMKRLKRLLVPLPYVLDQDQFYFHVLHIYQDMSRQLALYHALYDARVSVGHVKLGESWHQYFKPHGTEVVGEWGRDMVITTEALLVNVLAADTRLLSTAPDNLFTMVALAGGYVVGVKFLMFRGGSHYLGGSDLLLAKVVAHLSSVACAPGHAAQRAAFLIKGMLAKWEARSLGPPVVAASYPTPTSDRQSLADNLAAPSASTSTENLVDPSAFAAGNPNATSLPPFELDFSMFMDSTIPVDADFWNNLAQQTDLLPGYQ
ncbi:hypothetical protein DFH06DRAFT_1036905 [Mycena polygramma]|nr:hypothetical protein DFH06DRAFT_1036905 [Mycena polygramma]